MKLRIELTQLDLAALVRQYLENKGLDCSSGKIIIQTRSEQNYKSEWETAEYRAVYEENT